MNKKDKEEFANTLKQFSENAPHINTLDMIDILNKLHRYETSLNNLFIRYCNEDLTDLEWKRVDSIESKVQKIAESLKFKVDFNQDPRGAAIKFFLPKGRYNSWDGESWRLFW